MLKFIKNTINKGLQLKESFKAFRKANPKVNLVLTIIEVGFWLVNLVLSIAEFKNRFHELKQKQVQQA